MAASAPLDCRRASRLMSIASERELTPEERLALREHLDRCLKCRHFEGQLKFLREASRRYGK
ncbi:MAG TPA: zf-HC2 domain-containing protein [Usitatibacteraceae bacterium]|nr:zf-HC2 domain-containing protein [Usitatibacteraceae bacterium]